MNNIDWEAASLAFLFFVVVSLLAAGGPAFADNTAESRMFCLSVTAKTQDMLQLPWEERVKALSELKEKDPVLANHVVPATGAATQAWIRGATTTKILQGIYHSCKQHMQDA